jgi:cytidylate kinase
MASSTGNTEVVGVIAIDGPSGSGKSTVSRNLAARLRVPYLDTGAMYRAATWAVLQKGVDVADLSAVADVVADSELEVGIDPAGPTVELNGVDARGPIRGTEVTASVSAVAAIPAVRQILVAEQQRLIAAAVRGETEFAARGIVVEGRDIATVVAPDAVLKVYLTASEAARASRRHGESAQAGNVTQVQQDLARRDAIDSSRAVNPLRQDDSAVLVDTTAMSIDEVVTELVRLHSAAVAAR